MDVVATVAIVVTGLATVVLAVMTYLLVRENRKLITVASAQAEAGREQARASADQARAAAQMLGEVQYDRELAHAPYLKFEFRASLSNGEPVGPRLLLSNIGSGPALNCVYCAVATWERWPDGSDIEPIRESGYYHFPDPSPVGSPLHLAPGGAPHQHDAGLATLTTLHPQAETVLMELPHHVGRTEAAVCEDQFGNRYRFRTDQASPDRWKPGDPVPAWVRWIPLPLGTDS